MDSTTYASRILGLQVSDLLELLAVQWSFGEWQVGERRLSTQTGKLLWVPSNRISLLLLGPEDSRNVYCPVAWQQL